MDIGVYDKLIIQLKHEVSKDSPDYSYIKKLIYQTNCPHLIDEMTTKYLLKEDLINNKKRKEASKKH